MVGSPYQLVQDFFHQQYGSPTTDRGVIKCFPGMTSGGHHYTQHLEDGDPPRTDGYVVINHG